MVWKDVPLRLGFGAAGRASMSGAGATPTPSSSIDETSAHEVSSMAT